VAGLLLSKCTEKTPRLADIPQAKPAGNAAPTSTVKNANDVALEAAVATIENEVKAAKWPSYLPTVQDIQRRYPVFSTSAGHLALDQLKVKIDAKKTSLSVSGNQSTSSKANTPAKSGSACTREVLASRSTATLCSVLGTPRNTCSGSEVREELERRGVFVFEGACGSSSSPKSTGASTRTAAPSKEDAEVNRSRYIETLNGIEARRPELNPDSPLHRRDLVELAARRKQSYVRQGMPEHEALGRAVTDLEQEGEFQTPVKTVSPVAAEAPKAAKPRVVDPGGHSGFPANCRWLSAQEWSCL
jgi:hypothetical protein